jgi:hypothetical protein
MKLTNWSCCSSTTTKNERRRRKRRRRNGRRRRRRRKNYHTPDLAPDCAMHPKIIRSQPGTAQFSIL